MSDAPLEGDLRLDGRGRVPCPKASIPAKATRLSSSTSAWPSPSRYMGFFIPPDARRFALRNAHAPACLVAGDLPRGTDRDRAHRSADRRRAHRRRRTAPARSPAELGPDLDASMVLPGMVDCHTHLDKGHIWPRQPNPSGDVAGASRATAADRNARWDADDVRRAHGVRPRDRLRQGVVAIRTHLDSLGAAGRRSRFPCSATCATRWAGRIDLQASSIAPLDIFLTDEGAIAGRHRRRDAAAGSAASTRFRCAAERCRCRPSSTTR